jgi:hypothetical protein
MCYNITTERGKEKKKMKMVITTDYGSYIFNRTPFTTILEQYNELRAKGIKATLKCYIVGYKTPLIWNSRTQTFFIQY